MNRLFLFSLLIFFGCSSSGEKKDSTVADQYDCQDTADIETSAEDTLNPDIAEDKIISDISEIPSDTIPSPEFFFKVGKHEKTVKDESYSEETPFLYRTTEMVPGLNINVIKVIAGKVFIGNENGLYTYDQINDKFLNFIATEMALNIIDIAMQNYKDQVVSAAEKGIIITDYKGKFVTVFAENNVKISAVEVSGTKIWVGTDTGLFEVNSDLTAMVKKVPDLDIRDIATDSKGSVWMATGAGIKVYDGSSVAGYNAAGGMLPDDDVRAVASCGSEMLAGTEKGISIIKDNKEELIPAGVDGLPMDNITDAACSGDLIILGHATGATVYNRKDKHIDHYVSLRWIPDNEVFAVALEGDGTRWIGTHKGLSRITISGTTLSQKKDFMEDFQNSHYWRMDGFVPPDVSIQDPWVLDNFSSWDSDNDGLWTQMQIGAWCMAYSVTKDEKYYNKAKKAMQVMFLEIDVPAVDFEKAKETNPALGRGFVTRSLARSDEGSLYAGKADKSNWHHVAYKGHDYYWKDDTSSDETTGHFFGYPLYYDLCAKDDKERASVADHAGALAAYILKNGFQLIDLDGQKTTFGHWNPDHIGVAVDGIDACLANGYGLELCAESAYGGGWLNSIEILGHMLSAYHMTGDEKFYKAYDELITKYKYDQLVKFTENVFTVTMPNIANHSDHELAMLAYTTLLRYEPNEERRKLWLDSLLKFYEWEKKERNPVWAGVVALYSENGAMVEDAVRTLKEMPKDLREWLVDNNHRKDAIDNGLDRFGDPQWDRVFPYDEIRTAWWNFNPYEKKDGGNGKELQGPMAWLLGYWILRYAGVLI